MIMITYIVYEINMEAMMMSDLMLDKAFNLFIFDRETFCTDVTVKNYRNTVRYFCEFMADSRGCPASGIPCSSMSREDLKSYSRWLRTRPLRQGYGNGAESVRLSDRTVRNYCVDVKTFLNFLHMEGYIDDFFSGFRVVRAEKKAILPVSATEVARIDGRYNAKTATGIRNLCIVHLMLDAGLRSNEVRQLRVGHVFFDNRQILVRYGKGKKERIVPMGSQLRKYLYTWHSVYRPFTQHDYFLTSLAGGPVTESAVKSLFARLRSTSEVPRLTPHLLRHTFATSFIVGGGSVEMLRILLGHSSIETTQRYMHLAYLYDFQDNVYELDPIFFKTYSRIRR